MRVEKGLPVCLLWGLKVPCLKSNDLSDPAELK